MGIDHWPEIQQLGDALTRAMSLFDQLAEALLDMSGVLGKLSAGPRPYGQWRWPLDAQWKKITGRFGDNRGAWVHEGLDISVPAGTPVYAPHSGVVISAKFNTAYGNRVRIEWMENGERWWVWLAHLMRYSVAEGTPVTMGDLVGDSGNTGNSTGPHLHVTVQRESNKTLLRGLPETLRGCVDPLIVLTVPG